MILSLGTGFALISALAWSGFDASRKILANHVHPMPLMVAIMAGQAPLFALWGWVDQAPSPLVLWGSEGVESLLPYLRPGLVSLFANALGGVLFLFAVRLGEFSRVIPMLSLTPAFSALFGWWGLHETLSLGAWGGLLAVVLGAGFTSGFWESPRARDSERANTDSRRGAALMVGVALCWSLSSASDKLAAAVVGAPAHGWIQCIAMSAFLVALLSVHRMGSQGLSELKQLVRVPWAFIATLVFAAAAMAFQLLALSELYVGVFEALKRFLGLGFSLMIGVYYFKEPLVPTKWVGLGFMSVGAALLLALR